MCSMSVAAVPSARIVERQADAQRALRATELAARGPGPGEALAGALRDHALDVVGRLRVCRRDGHPLEPNAASVARPLNPPRVPLGNRQNHPAVLGESSSDRRWI